MVCRWLFRGHITYENLYSQGPCPACQIPYLNAPYPITLPQLPYYPSHFPYPFPFCPCSPFALIPLYPVYCVLGIYPCTLYTVPCILYTFCPCSPFALPLPFSNYPLPLTLLPINPGSLYTGYCILGIYSCTLYTGYIPLYPVYCTLYTVYFV